MNSGPSADQPDDSLTDQIESAAVWPPPLSDTPLEFEVRSRTDNRRIDAYLSNRFADYSRHVIQKIIDAGGVLVNGRPVKASYRVRPGDAVSIRLPELPDTAPQPEDIPLEVLYEDDALTVVNKPAGMVTHPARGNWRGTLVNALQFHFDSLSTLAGELRPGIVHRLDRDTTGLLVVVKDDRTHRRLAEQFERREVQKQYLALVAGVPQRHSDYIAQPIGFHPTHREKMAIRLPADGGKEAVTFYEVIERFKGFALVRCKPETGRTHQIRVHLTHIGHPILADKLYSGRDRITLADLLAPANRTAVVGASETVLLDRQALHAYSLKFRHPSTGAELSLEAPLPEDMARTLAALRVHCS
jgi:23S rRNA pseudouridine1911/1915/1917 synthase